jgi:hypothetical protein
MALPWRGYFINLDRSGDRRAAMEAQLARAGLGEAYQRFAAIGGEGRPAGCRLLPGQYGCFRSHHDLLAAAPPDGRHVHVLEDDAVLAPDIGRWLQSTIAAGPLAAFDIAFTDISFGDDLPLIRMLKQLFDRSIGRDGAPTLSVLDLRTVAFSATTSYLVSPGSVGRVAAALKRGLDAGPTRPVDLHLRDEVRAGRLRAALIFPFLTSVDGGQASTIVEADVTKTATLLLRNSFFLGRDLAASRRQLDAILAGAGAPRTDAHFDLVADILRFYASDRFKPF